MVFRASIVSRISVCGVKELKTRLVFSEVGDTPQAWWVLRKHLLSTGPLLRMSTATLIAVSAIIGYLKFAFPGIVLPNLWSVVFLLPAVIGFTVLQMGILSLFRYRVLVTPKKIVISHGQSATIIKPESLNCVTLTVHDFGKNRIRFNYGLKSKNRLVTVGLSDDRDLFKLAELLPIEMVIKDARRNPKR